MAFGMLQNQKVFILFVGIIFMLVLLFFLLKMPITSKFRVIHVLMVFIISGDWAICWTGSAWTMW